MGSSDSAAHAPGLHGGSRAYRRLLLALFFAGIATFGQLYSTQALLPHIATSFAVSAADAALTVSLATGGLTLSVLAWSVIADRFGRRRLMFVAIIAATVLGLCAPLAPTFGLLLAFRLAEGVALGGIPALALAYLSEEVHVAAMAAAAGTYISGTAFGGLTGRLLSSGIDALGHWRLGMLAVSILCAVCAVCFIALAPAQKNFHPSAISVPRLLRTLGTLLRNAPLRAVLAQGFFLMGTFVATFNFLGFYLLGAPFHLPVVVASLLYLTYLAGTFSARAAGTLAGRFGRLPVLLCGIALMLSGLGLMLIAWLPCVVVGVLLLTTGFFGAHGISNGWAAVLAPEGKAQAAALYNLLYYAGSSALGWSLGLVLSAFGWQVLVFAMMASCCAAAGFALRSLRQVCS